VAVDIAFISPEGERFDVNGRLAGRQGIIMAAGQVQNIYGAPISQEWKRAARERGGRFKSQSFPVRDMAIGLHLFGDDHPDGIEYLETMMDHCFPSEPDEWDPDWQPGRIVVKSKNAVRRLFAMRYEGDDFEPDYDPHVDDYENPILKLRAGMPFWEARPKVTAWETDGTSGSGFIEVSNPTPVLMFQAWRLTLGTWSIPDPSWVGQKGKRVPGGEYGDRVVNLLPIDPVHGGARINYDPMRLMLESWSGTNLLGENGGRDFFMHKIPPFTTTTMLPISVTGAPAGVGARAELHQPRLWLKPWGGEWR
jgi:hypothetical protein